MFLFIVECCTFLYIFYFDQLMKECIKIKCAADPWFINIDTIKIIF